MTFIIKKYKNPLIYLLTIIFVFLLWLVLSLLIDSSLILPSPVSSIKEIFYFFKDGSFYLSLLFTCLRAIIAFIISFIVTLILVLMSLNATLRNVVKLITSITRGIPTMAIILILIIWMKPSIAPIIVATLVLIPILYEEFLTICDSFKSEFLPVILVYNIKKRDIIKLFFKEKMSNIFDFSASSLGFSLKLVISAEALALSYYGLGSIMQFSKIYLEMEKLFALAIIAVFLGLLLEVIIKSLKRWFLKIND